MSRSRHALVAVTTAALLALLALPAAAHVTANPNVATSPYHKIDFRIPHGCERSATTEVRVQIPDGVVGVKPQVTPGWEIETEIGEIEPYDSHGTEITEGVREVRWTGGNLPDEHLQEFGLSVRFLDGAGDDEDVVYFPTVQICEEGEHRWIEIPDSVDQWGELDEPAPYVTLALTGDGHGTSDDEEADTAAAPADTTGAELTSDVAAAGTSPVTWFALAAGLIGLALGAAALVRRGRAA